MLTIKNVIFCFCALFLFGCSDTDGSNTSAGDLTKEECEKIGGRIIEGMGCAKDIPMDEMKKICENNGMKYVEELDGCIE